MKSFKTLLLFVLFLTALSISAAENKTIRILAIGNSFSQDAVEQYLHELAQAEGYTAIIGNMYIGGCSLERHYNNAIENKAEYYYRKIGTDGKKAETQNYTLENALQDEQWDYVSLQQASGKSGLYDTYTPYLPSLINYVKSLAPATAKIVWHQTWAYAQNSTHSEFKNYGNDQITMYKAIVSAARRAVTDNNIGILVPSGTAVQNARTTFIGDEMNRDGYHLNILYGRYTAACTWFETIFGKSVVGNSYTPEGMTKDLILATQTAAHAAVDNPDGVTDLSYIKEMMSDEVFFIRPDEDIPTTSGGDGKTWETALKFSEWTDRLGAFDKGTTFCFSGGTYYPSAPISINNAFTLIGGFAPNSTGTASDTPEYPSTTPTVFSGDYNKSGSADAGDLPAIIKADMTKAAKNTLPITILGIDFTSAYCNSSDGKDEYGAIYMKDCQNMNVKNCRFYGNAAPGHGGIAVRSEYSRAHFTDCTFTGNKAGSRGGVARLSSNTGSKGNTTFERCSFTGNSVDEGTGSVICMQHGQALYIINTTVADNNAGNGGAIYANGKNSTFANALYVISSTIAGNSHNQTQTAQGGRMTIVNSIVVSDTDNGTTADAAIIVTGTTDTPLSFTSLGYNILGGYANQLSTTTAPAWHDTDNAGSQNTTATIFGNAVTTNGALVPLNTRNGASISFLSETATSLGISDSDLTIDQHGNPRSNGIPGAVDTSIQTGIRQATASGKTGSAMYNLAGLRIDKDYKGIAISNGRKVLYK